MGSKKFLYGFCIFYLMSLLGYQSVLAQTRACHFSDSDIEGVEVGQIGDRQIYTLFTVHLSREANRVFAIMDRYRPVDAITALNQLIEMNQEIIASEQSDVQKVTQLAESGKIDWIGVETFETNTSGSSFAYLEGRARLGRVLNHLRGWDSSKTDQLLLLLFDADIIAYATHPEVFRGIRKYPLEDEVLATETLDLFRDSAYWEGVIERDNYITESQRLEINSFIRGIIISEPRLITEFEFESLLDRIEVLEEARINIRRLREIYNDIISLIFKRNEVIVQSILDIPGNGLILFGAAHEPGIKQGLITACQNGHSLP